MYFDCNEFDYNERKEFDYNDLIIMKEKHIGVMNAFKNHFLDN